MKKVFYTLLAALCFGSTLLSAGNITNTETTDNSHLQTDVILEEAASPQITKEVSPPENDIIVIDLKEHQQTKQPRSIKNALGRILKKHKEEAFLLIAAAASACYLYYKYVSNLPRNTCADENKKLISETIQSIKKASGNNKPSNIDIYNSCAPLNIAIEKRKEILGHRADCAACAKLILFRESLIKSTPQRGPSL